MEGLDYLGASAPPPVKKPAPAPRAKAAPGAAAKLVSPALTAKAKQSAARANSSGQRAIASGQKMLAKAKKSKNTGAVARANAIIARGQKAQAAVKKAAIMGLGPDTGAYMSPDAQQAQLLDLITNLDWLAGDAEQGANEADAIAAALDEGQAAVDIGTRAQATGQRVLSGNATAGQAAIDAGTQAITAGNAAQDAANNPPVGTGPHGDDVVSVGGINAAATAAHAASQAAWAAMKAANAAPGGGVTNNPPPSLTNVQALITVAQNALSQVQYATQSSMAQQNQMAFSQLSTISQQLTGDINAGQQYLANPSAAGAAAWATQIGTDTNNATSAIVMLQQGGMGTPGPMPSGGGFGGGSSDGGGFGGGGGGGDDGGDDTEQQMADEDEASRGVDFVPPADSQPDDAPQDDGTADLSDGNMNDDEQQAADEDGMARGDMLGADFDWLNLASGAAGMVSSFGGGVGSKSGGKSESDKLAALLAKQKADEDLRRAQDQASTLKTVVVGGLVLVAAGAAWVMSKRKAR